MKDKNADIKNAIDEIFGDDFLEIDTSSTEDNSLIDKAVFTDYELEEEKENEQEEVNLIDSYNKPIIENIKDEDKYTESPNNIEVNDEVIKDDVVIKENNEINVDRKNKININYKLIGIIFGIIIMLLLLIITIYYTLVGVEKTETCSISARDDGYKFSDEYVITYRKNNIKKIKSTYSYVSYSEKYNDQIKIIKTDKLPVIVNSNGMPGFTYIMEEKSDMLKITGYLDFESMDFVKVDKQDQKLFPLSYETFNSKTTYKVFKKKLLNNGFTCNISN